MPNNLNPMAPYFVQMRELERHLLQGALAQAVENVGAGARQREQIEFAARILGIKFAYFRVRARYLGGVLDGEPRCEPPTRTVTQSWARESVRTGPKPKRKPKLVSVPPAEAAPDA